MRKFVKHAFELRWTLMLIAFLLALTAAFACTDGNDGNGGATGTATRTAGERPRTASTDAAEELAQLSQNWTKTPANISL
ncbi:MAG TPA: hypothetical protein VNL15_07490 [Dehalococcoidia bacterium]|nr:hypothetical protein [Dehalococcoidia bacterium]